MGGSANFYSSSTSMWHVLHLSYGLRFSEITFYYIIRLGLGWGLTEEFVALR